MRRAPEHPSGWPSAIAPPFTFTFSMSGWCSFAHASTTGANASLISTRSISSSVMPARSSTFDVAGIGPVSIITGSTPASANVWNRARGVSPSSLRLVLAHDERRGRAVGDLRRVRRGDHAVGLERGLELRELLDARVGADALVARAIVSGPSSVVTSTGHDLALEAPLVGGARGVPVRLRPRTRRSPRARSPTSPRSARPRCPAARGPGSAPSSSGRTARCRAASMRPSGRASCARRRRRSRRRTRRPSHPAPRSARPAATSRTGGRRSCPTTVSGNPAASAALRPTLMAWSPTCMTQPMITSSTSAGIEVVALDERAQRVRGEVDRVPVLELAVPAPQRGADGVDDHGGRHRGPPAARAGRTGGQRYAPPSCPGT